MMLKMVLDAWQAFIGYFWSEETPDLPDFHNRDWLDEKQEEGKAKA